MNGTSSMASAVSAGRVSVKLPFMSVDMPRVCPASVTRTVAPITGAPFSSLTTPFTVWRWGAASLTRMILRFSKRHEQSGSICRTTSDTGLRTAATDTIRLRSKSPLL